MKKFVLATALFGVAAVTMVTSLTANAATPEERAKCEEMFKKMGETTDQHSQPKAPPGPDPMTGEHQRCKEILGYTGQDRPASSGDHGGKPEKK